ncbi:YqjF family protein [Oleiharenicola sp. Vm1]|uniref:YqjF family protein n=1 Tax=Oleiharenicola sp. Vm1 TaxID=3398393 RepID=UPI0039F62497
MEHPALAQTSHRPWPLPAAPWTWQQSWLDLAFLHYRAAPGPIERLLPRGIRLQQFDGSAWLGVVPFRMARLGPRGLHGLARLPDFPELNLRTYVEAEGKPGVWFFSLDAASRLAVFGGRRFFNLPYLHAAMAQERSGAWIDFRSRRHGARAEFRGRYRPVGPRLSPRPGSFAHWATERYALYAVSRRGALRRVEVHHAPWPLHEAEVELEHNSIVAAAGLEVLADRPICHFSPGVDVVSFGAESVRAG